LILRRSILWRSELSGSTLAIYLQNAFRTLGWAPLGGGSKRAELILNHQISLDNRGATESPRRYLGRVVRSLGVNPRHAVAMMTGAQIKKAASTTEKRGDMIVTTWCTAGCSNALRVGDPASVEITAPGTINLIVLINQPLSEAAMVEAIQIATEARVAAVLAARVKSVRSGRPATGTGTDCIVIAAPEKPPMHFYCGKHTRLGELIGRAAYQSCLASLARRR
jgi:adenosylcobinamide amidohydrolase